ncbi:MAG: DUF305 domain-containing protein, partial [Candidatus Paceibacterota bacterium]
MNNNTLSDLDYVNHMIPHHQLAIDMSEQIIPYTNSYVILDLSRDIIRKQKWEIWEMSNMIGYSRNDIFIHKPSEKDMIINETQYLQHMIPHH